MSLDIKNVGMVYETESGHIQALDQVNLQIRDGEFICVVGPSGCGKSTLLNIIAGLEHATDGEVLLDGQRITAPGPDRAVMFQEAALYPWMRAVENVEFGMKAAGVPPQERHQRAMKYLDLVRLKSFAQAYPHELSGGMRQRVALARALTLDSKVLLMDEPFAALDSQTRNILQLELQHIWMETKKTIFFVTHNVEEAVMLADRVIVFSAHPGHVKKVIKIELARPRQRGSIDLTFYVKSVMKDLAEEVEKVAKKEYGDNWSFEDDTVLHNPDSDMGAYL
ncbi:MAG TPA: nitrate/sulfonate/bicarbonate ABC transporter ATP-binding protein [Ruminococcaceae bacterium]|nr:nitrate/sulfonate/bicarbonate ABC transporter ATP-binding protein [Oscillospiraceae bacterium]HCM24832.1 nitrate/sulfonate/bicarbonate ABC transporter ATP-binding protein [Oscillospiraceae bacterium]